MGKGSMRFLGFVVGIWLGLWGLAASVVVGGCGGGGGTTTTVTANAGDDQEVLVGDTVALDGQASTGVGNIAWTFVSRPSGSSATLSDATTLTASFEADVAGEYSVQLSVNAGAATDTVAVTAVAVQAAITVPSGSAVTTRTRFNSTEYVIDLAQTGGILSGEGSRAAGLNAALKSQSSVASYSWEQISGPGATETNGTTNATLEFTAPSFADFFNASDHYKWQVLPVSRDDTKMVFKLTVTASDGTSDTSLFTVYVQDGGLEIHTSSGLPNVGIGTTVILSGPNLDASGASATVAANEEGDPITDWSWSLSVPSGSSATFLDSGATTSTLQFPSFVPDVAGLYTVGFSSTTGNTGATAYATNKVPGTLTINAADYVGVGTIGGTTPVTPQCATCHGSSPLSGLDDKVTAWSGTEHADLFEDSMSTYAGLAPEPYLWQFHTVGYNPDAANDGFDDLAGAAGFTFPEEGLTFSEFTSTYPSVAKLAGNQCENCHGPGGQHAGDPSRIAHSFAQFGVCGQCHIQETQWANSAHNMTGVKHGSGTYQNYWATNAKCVRCHNAGGFATYVEEGEEGLAAVAAAVETGEFVGITCAGCHNPHDATNENQLRIAGNVTMIADSSTVDAGKAAVCYTCHDGNYSHNETDCDTNADGISTGNTACATRDQTATEYWRGGYHYNPQSPMLEGKQAITDLSNDGTNDLTLDENSFHSSSSFIRSEVTGDSTLSSTNDKCVTCHMAEGPSSDEEGYLHLGGHAFKLRVGHGIGHLQGGEEAEDTEEEAGEIENVSACTVCHPSVTEINRTARADYDGDGTIEGIQDEVSGLLLNLSTKIKALDTTNVNQAATTYNTDVGTTESGGVITVGSLGWAGECTSFSGTTGAGCGTGIAGTGSCANRATGRERNYYKPCSFLDANVALRRAVWNHNSIVRDGSLGIHNAAYTIQVLQETYKALGILLEGDAATTTYKTDYASATLR